jgi:lysophospholipase L1-like esterase
MAVSRRQVLAGAAVVGVGFGAAHLVANLLPAPAPPPSSPPPAPIAPTVPGAVYLPSVSASPSCVVGVRALVSGYTAPLFEVQRASDWNTMPVSQRADGLADTAAVAAWAGGSEVRIRTLYDQSGNARHLTASDWSAMAFFDAAGRYGVATSFGAFAPAIFDGYMELGGGNRVDRRYVIPAGTLADRQSASVFITYENRGAAVPATMWSFGQVLALNSTASLGVFVSGKGNVAGRRPRQQYHTEGLVTSARETKILQDGIISRGEPRPSASLAGMAGLLGAGVPGANEFFISGGVLGAAFYADNLSDEDAGAVAAAMDGTFGCPGLGADQVVLVGDSILVNSGVGRTQYNRTMTRMLRSLLGDQPSLYNMGISGQRFLGGDGGGALANAAAREFMLAGDGLYRNRVLVVQIGTNDLGANGQVPGFGAQLYSAISGYVADARSAGYSKVLICTILPRSNKPVWQDASSQHNLERADYNVRVRDNLAGADGIIDLAAHPLMGSYATTLDTEYYRDGLHPTGFGGELLAPLYASAIKTVLAG